MTVDLLGETFIDGKTGITSATFRNTPDVPFESIEVTVPSGPFSEFGANLPANANGSFCGQKLVMPTFFKAQNGLEIHQNTPVGVTGCPKAKTRAQLLRRRAEGLPQETQQEQAPRMRTTGPQEVRAGQEEQHQEISRVTNPCPLSRVATVTQAPHRTPKAKTRRQNHGRKASRHKTHKRHKTSSV